MWTRRDVVSMVVAGAVAAMLALPVAAQAMQNIKCIPADAKRRAVWTEQAAGVRDTLAEALPGLDEGAKVSDAALEQTGALLGATRKTREAVVSKELRHHLGEVGATLEKTLTTWKEERSGKEAAAAARAAHEVLDTHTRTPER